MPAHTARRKERSAWIWVLSIIGGVGILALLATIALIALPPVLANLSTHTALVDETVTSDDGHVQAIAPAGWTVQSPWLDGGLLTLGSPDGMLRVDIRAADADPQAAFDIATAAEDAAGTPLESPVTETIDGGRVIVHAETADQRIVVVAVGEPGTSPSAIVTAQVSPEATDDYLPALAELLPGIRAIG
ncbi:hypothetical protein GCM10009808_01020 [Microbacterium sediminicola]|uniref:Uncharacterized protein n=1 Tax=Microbacterium sediminicola TaxID=415210 RepID=A0ABN2HH20_9MICO